MSSGKSRSRIWSAWGDWVWSNTQSRYYSQRQDTRGEIETRWGPVHTATAPEEKPRYASGDYSEDNEDYCYDYDHDNEQPAGDHSEDNKDYCYDYDYGNEQPSFGLQFQGGGYDGGSQGQNDHSAPPEGGSDEYPESSPRWYQTASGGVDERDVGASRHGPRRGYNIMSGDDQEPDVQTPRHPYGSYESEDGEQDISSQDPKKNSRRKGKAPAQDEPPPYKQGNSSSHSGHDSNVYYRGDDGKFYKGVGKSSRRDKNVYYRGDDGRLHKGIGKNRGNQGRGGQNDRDTKIGRSGI